MIIYFASLEQFKRDCPGPTIARHLADGRQINPAAANIAAIYYGFGVLIGNTDMHNGNLSFIAEHGRPYAIAPAYDMTPMAFAPKSGGGLPETLASPVIHASIDSPTWRQVLRLAGNYLVLAR